MHLLLGKRIMVVEGFATYRYTAGYSHEPDPSNPLAVSLHGNKMADRDSLLPRLPAKALKGAFAKTHLVTLLQLYKAGVMPELTAWFAAPRGRARPRSLARGLVWRVWKSRTEGPMGLEANGSRCPRVHAPPGP